MREKFPCYIVVPQCPAEQKWVDWDWRQSFTQQPEKPAAPMVLALGLLDTLLKEFPDVDTDRLYITGISMGGYGTWDAVTRFPDRFAAAVPICGGGDPAKAAVIAKLPVWAIHGDADPAVQVDQTRRMIAAIKAAGGAPLYSEYPGVGHESWTPGYQEPELLPWMFAQRRGQAAVAFEKIAPALAQPPSSLFPGEGPVQPGIWFRALWQNRRGEWARTKTQDEGAVVFLGDSITQGWGTLAQDFAGVKVANRGISGDTTRGVRLRLKGDVLDVHPRAVTLLIGTNDIGLGATPELVAENVNAIIAELHAADPKLPIIACRVMPSDASKQRPADKIQRLNALVDEAVANDPLVTRVDTFGLFADEQGNAKKDEFPDLLHPNAAGYAKWAEALRPIFGKLQLSERTP